MSGDKSRAISAAVAPSAAAPVLTAAVTSQIKDRGYMAQRSTTCRLASAGCSH
jgi:hypothetical protein